MSESNLCNSTEIIKKEENIELLDCVSKNNGCGIKGETSPDNLDIPLNNLSRKRLSGNHAVENEKERKLVKSEILSEDNGNYLNGNRNAKGIGNSNCSANGESFSSNQDATNSNNRVTNNNPNNQSKKHNLNSAVFNHDSESKRIHMESKINQDQLGSKDYLYKYMYVEKYENGGGYILHAYQDELAQLELPDLELFVNRYFKCLFRETQHNNNHPYSLYCMGIIHGSARKLPELLSYLSEKHESLFVKTNLMEFKNDTQTVTMGDYAKNVYKNYKNGLFRYGPMHSVSLVGTKGEETGGYFKDIIKYLERNPFLKQVMPWGPLSKLSGMSPMSSNDGPILWIRHGEQAVPSSTNKKKRKSRWVLLILSF